MKEIIIIAAVSENNVIGNKGKIPWHIADDLKRFKDITMGKTVIMGEVTFESLPVKPLPGRRNIVITQNKNFSHEGVETAYSFDEALSICSDEDEVYIIGGQMLYEAAMKIATRLELTRVHKNYDGDKFFPKFDEGQWKKIKEEKKAGYSFITYIR